MNRTEAKAWAQDVVESISKCVFADREVVRKIRIKAPRLRAAGTLVITDADGNWAASYSPRPDGWLYLESFVFGEPPGRIVIPLRERTEVENRFEVQF